MITVPIIIVFLGFILTQQKTISIEERVLAPEGWSIKKIAYKYSPVLFQAVNDKKPNWDYVCRVDFDNDWDPLNNSNNIRSKNIRLDAAIYYSVVESETHFFITYSIFHAVDWGFKSGSIQKWYENDVKSLQVVVEKEHRDSLDGKIIFLTIQDGEDVKIYNAAKLSFRRENQKFAKGDVVLLDEFGKEDKKGTHPGIFIEEGRHNIQNMVRDDIRLMRNDGLYTIRRGITYLPSLATTGEIPKNNTKLNYVLLETSKLLWERNAENPDELYSFFDSERFDYSDDYIRVKSNPV